MERRVQAIQSTVVAQGELSNSYMELFRGFLDQQKSLEGLSSSVGNYNAESGTLVLTFLFWF